MDIKTLDKTVNFNALTRLCDKGQQAQDQKKKDSEEIKIGGNMFDYMVPNEAGVFIKCNHRAKYSKKEYEDVVGKMSLETYWKKTSVR